MAFKGTRRQPDTLPIRSANQNRHFPEGLLHLLEVIRLIGRDVQFSVRLKRAGRRAPELRRHDASILMPPFRPGIGEHQIEQSHGLRGEKLLDGMQDLEAHDTRIIQLAVLDFLASASHPSHETFHANEMPLRVLLRPSGQERTVPTSKVYFQGRSPAEDLNPINRSEKTFRN